MCSVNGCSMWIEARWGEFSGASCAGHDEHSRAGRAQPSRAKHYAIIQQLLQSAPKIYFLPLLCYCDPLGKCVLNVTKASAEFNTLLLCARPRTSTGGRTRCASTELRRASDRSSYVDTGTATQTAQRLLSLTQGCAGTLTQMTQRKSLEREPYCDAREERVHIQIHLPQKEKLV